MKRLLFGLLIAGTLSAESGRDYSILKKDGEEFAIQPHVAPIIYVRQISGPTLPEKGSINCEWGQETTNTPKGDHIHILAGRCENGVVLHITGIDLNH